MQREIDPMRLRIARVSRGLRQRDLAGLMPIAPQRISDFETGVRRPTPEQVSRLAKLLGATIAPTRRRRTE